MLLSARRMAFEYSSFISTMMHTHASSPTQDDWRVVVIVVAFFVRGGGGWCVAVLYSLHSTQQKSDAFAYFFEALVEVLDAQIYLGSSHVLCE